MQHKTKENLTIYCAFGLIHLCQRTKQQYYSKLLLKKIDNLGSFFPILEATLELNSSGSFMHAL